MGALAKHGAHTFARHFCVTKPQFECLARKLQDNGVEKHHSQGLPPVPTTKKVLVFLWYMATQHSFREIAARFDLSQSTVHRIIAQVHNIMSTIGSCFISWPNTCEKAASAAAFHRLCGLSDVIGVIDGCHIRGPKATDKRRRLHELQVFLFCPPSGDCG